VTTTVVPRRVQRRRDKGWRMPADTVYVGRPSRWGNSYPVGMLRPNLPPLTATQAVRRFERRLSSTTSQPLGSGVDRAVILTHLPELRGKHLACWCPLTTPCHADVLLRLAQPTPTTTRRARRGQTMTPHPTTAPYNPVHQPVTAGTANTTTERLPDERGRSPRRPEICE
jgi:hypothetical protein